MLLEGLTLTIVGMAVVFVFLALLVFVMKALSTFMPKYFPDQNTAVRSAKGQSTVESQKEQQSSGTYPVGEAEIAAVIAAVKSYSHI